MRTRNKSYSDYGITDVEKKYIFDFCKNATEEHKKLIKSALSELDPYISPFIYYSLLEGLSYDKLSIKNELCVSKEDFYGYRRKGIDAIKRWLIWNGMWNHENIR